MSQISRRFLKGQTYSFARSDCVGCWQLSRCISGSPFAREDRYYFMTIKGFKPPATPLMEQGRESHARSLRGIPTLEEYGYEHFFADLSDCKPIQLSELVVCSRLYGFRGHLDLFFIHQVTPGQYHLRVTELKSSYQKSYLFQLICYSLIASDPNFEVHVKKPLRHKPDKFRILGRKVIRQDIPSLVNIESVLGYDIGKEKPRFFIRPFMVENQLTDWGLGLSMALQKRANSFRRYQRVGIYDAKNIPFCHRCSLFREVDPDSACAFTGLCAPLGYSPKIRSFQTFWGKRGMPPIVKSKPAVRKVQPIE